MQIRLADPADIPELSALIPLSARALSLGYYKEREAEAAIRYVFGVDTQLVSDRSYFVAEAAGALVGCGGWSRRRSLYGGDKMKTGPDPLLDPATDAARIRAFFVHPDHARRGIASMLMRACITAARDAGFQRLELVATLPGEPLYQRFGFVALERFEDTLPDFTRVRVVRMGAAIADLRIPPGPPGAPI
jgi:GNAT superfamily N-acetyltransferase